MPFGFSLNQCSLLMETLLSGAKGDARQRENAETASNPSADDAVRPPQDEYG